MKNITITTIVDDIRYRLYKNDGILETYIVVNPSITLPDGSLIDKIRCSAITNASEFALGHGDVIRLETHGSNLQITGVKLLSTNAKNSLAPTVCPFCGEPLVMINNNYACLNKLCTAQVGGSILTFVAGLGMVFTTETNYILRTLLARGALTSPVDLFFLSTEDLTTISGVTDLDARMFQQYVHSIRGHVEPATLLRSISIPMWTDADYVAVSRFFKENNLSLSDMNCMLMNERFCMQNMPAVNWTAWFTFLRKDTNARMLAELIHVLAH